MAGFSDQVKRFVVKRLACFYSPSEVVKELKEVYGQDAIISQVMYYDPTTSNGAKLASEWKELFKSERERFIQSEDEIPIAHRAFRLRELEDLYRRNKKNPKIAADLLKQAAEEKGGVYTNRRVNSFENESDADLIARTAALLRGVSGSDGGAQAQGDID